MFGGKITDKIYRAHEGRPTDWVDTGAKLPTPLYGSHLSIIDGYIYLFGGNNGLATDTIYSAPVSDPLTWTNHGSLLPRKLYYSQCIVTANDGYICLFGGYTYNNPTGLMFYAKTSDPLMWHTHQQLILYPLYGSSAAIINNNIYLYGGMESDSIFSPRKTILYANIDELFADQSICAWHNATQTLPYGYSFGQFITIGSGGYIFAADSEESFTKIFYCSLSDPLTWTQLTTEIPYTLYQSQLAIINDRIFFFGGNGNSLILACDPLLYYIYSAPEVLAYGDITRTQYQAATNKEDLSLILGFPYWKTNYVSNL